MNTAPSGLCEVYSPPEDAPTTVTYVESSDYVAKKESTCEGSESETQHLGKQKSPLFERVTGNHQHTEDGTTVEGEHKKGDSPTTLRTLTEVSTVLLYIYCLCH